MDTRGDLLRAGLRYDPSARRKSSRRTPGERGVWVFIPGTELRNAGIDTDAEPPEYGIATSETNPGAVFLRFYR